MKGWYPQFEDDMEAASRKWDVRVNAVNQGVRYVEAQAGTGSRYVVVVSPLPVLGARHEGGPMLVTVLSPWQAARALSPEGHLAVSYVAEHLCGEHRDRHGGDLQALTMTIRVALGRDEFDG